MQRLVGGAPLSGSAGTVAVQAAQAAASRFGWACAGAAVAARSRRGCANPLRGSMRRGAARTRGCERAAPHARSARPRRGLAGPAQALRWRRAAGEAAQTGADVSADRGHARFIAALNGSVEVVQALIDCCADVTVRAGIPLLLAASEGWLPVVRLLLRWGADPNDRNTSALRLAIEGGHDAVAAALRGAGAHIDLNPDQENRS